MTKGRWRRFRRLLVEPFPVVDGNSFHAWERGPDYMDRMLAAIDEARASVDVEMYLWDDDDVGRRFVEALRAAAARGLAVRVLIDALGAAQVAGPLGVVRDAGGDVRVFNPFTPRYVGRYFHRTHKKLIVCDAELAFTGGAGFSVHWSSGRVKNDDWHDWMFAVRGPVVRDLVRLFDVDFGRWPPGRSDVRERPDTTTDFSRPGTARLRVLRGWPDAHDYRVELLSRVRAAKERVWLGTPYLIPPRSFLRALRAAATRGVDVRIVLPSGNHAHPLIWHACRRHYRRLLRRGVRIREYGRGFYHAKLAVIDRDAAIVGSSNLDYWSWNRNAEIDLIALDPDAVGVVAACFEADFARSVEVMRRDVRALGWWARAKDAVAGLLEGWL